MVHCWGATPCHIPPISTLPEYNHTRATDLKHIISSRNFFPTSPHSDYTSQNQTDLFYSKQWPPFGIVTYIYIVFFFGSFCLSNFLDTYPQYTYWSCNRRSHTGIRCTWFNRCDIWNLLPKLPCLYFCAPVVRYLLWVIFHYSLFIILVKIKKRHYHRIYDA